MIVSHVFAVSIGSLFAFSAPVFAQPTPNSTGAESMGPSTIIPGVISVPGMPSSISPSGSTGSTSSRSSLGSALNANSLEIGSPSSLRSLPLSPGSEATGKTGGEAAGLGSSGLGANAGAGGGGMGSVGGGR